MIFHVINRIFFFLIWLLTFQLDPYEVFKRRPLLGTFSSEIYERVDFILYFKYGIMTKSFYSKTAVMDTKPVISSWSMQIIAFTEMVFFLAYHSSST